MVKFIRRQNENEENLKDLKEIALTALDNIAEGILVLSREFKIIFANKKIMSLSGLRESEVIGNFCYKVTHHREEPCQPPYDICPIQKILETGKPITVLHTHFDKEGNEFYAEVSAYPVKDEKGEVVQFVHIARDVTDRVKAERTLALAVEAEKKKTAELEKAYKQLEEMQDMLIQAEKLNAVGRLASGVAHEVRNPLGIILQGINYIENKLSPQEEDSIKVLDMMKDNIKRADKIIRSLFDFSKVTDLSLQPEDINSILENSLELVNQRIRFERIEIIKETKQDIPKVLVDKNRIEQVFINLFLNALEAMPAGGRVIVRSYDTKLEKIGNKTDRRSEDYFNLGERVVIVEIEDTGIGIPEENLKRIFDTFFTTKGPRGGAGLGLSVSRNIIELHQGLIEVKSQLGKGTKITITLKIA